MKLLPVSDLHLSFHADKGRALTDEICAQAKAEGAVLVLAGDVDEQKLQASLKRFAESGVPIVYILGNHECWGRTMAKAKAIPQAIASKFPNFHFLDKSYIDIEGVRIHGCTGWFPETPASESMMFSDKLYITGYRDIYQEAKEGLSYLLDNVRPGDVVVTHHLPHTRSIAPQYIGDSSNAFFLNETLTQVIEKNRPALWVHGHTHHQRGYRTHQTDVVCNPFGYLIYEPTAQNAFRSDLVLEVLPHGHGAPQP